jgi:hypothetical protein
MRLTRFETSTGDLRAGNTILAAKSDKKRKLWRTRCSSIYF